MHTDNTTKENKKNFLSSTNPATREVLPETYPVTTTAELNATVEAAKEAWTVYKNTSGKAKAEFFRTIAKEIENLGDKLVQRAMAESGLPEGRIKGERGRTCNQLRLFADLVEEGSWVNAVIDEAMPDRQPAPRVDIRKFSVALGPVAIFTASNFPLAFSTAGGDTASALAAGCPVIVKAHPSHLGTNKLVSEAISTAVEKCNLPKGVYAYVTGDLQIGQDLVQHSSIQAVGFTGSFRGGKALFDLASNRPEPIPVYAEMGSNNPIFILPEKLNNEHTDLAKTIAGAVNLGAGQFCTNPGILVVQKSSVTDTFLQDLKTAFADLNPSTMLNEGIYKNYKTGKKNSINTGGVTTLFDGENGNEKWEGAPAVATVAATEFLKNKSLQEEVFGPFTLAVVCENESEAHQVANSLHGQLTATVMATTSELEKSTDLIDVLTQKAGRVIYNGVPTGVEVGYAMHHGGPFPSASSGMYTSVGTDAIQRFVRPVCFQNMPDAVLPDALKKDNPLNIWRTVNGEKTRG